MRIAVAKVSVEYQFFAPIPPKLCVRQISLSTGLLGWPMIRFVFIAALILVSWLVLGAVWRRLKAADLDWNGIAFAVGFVALAFYLRHVTGMG